MTGISGIEARLVAMFDSRAVFWLVLLVALGVGAAHAVAPGHGKTITAAYLVGTRGRYRDALRLGVVVALMHTLSVLVLAVAWVGLTRWTAAGTERVTAWMQVLAGIVVVGVGGHLAYRHLRHGAAHGHHHDHADRHHDTVALTDPWSRRGLVAIALSGGLLPSPSAFLVLVTGLLTGRSVDALLLVVAFGVGLAGTLTAVGVLTIRGYASLAGRARRWAPLVAMVAWMPVIAGLAVATAGASYVLTALGTLTR